MTFTLKNVPTPNANEVKDWFEGFKKERLQRLHEAMDRVKRYMKLATYPPNLSKYENDESSRVQSLISSAFWKGYIFAINEVLDGEEAS